MLLNWFHCIRKFSFVIQAASKDVIQLHTAIDRRILALKSNQEEALANQNETSCDSEAPDYEVEAFDGKADESEDASKSPGIFLEVMSNK